MPGAGLRPREDPAQRRWEAPLLRPVGVGQRQNRLVSLVVLNCLVVVVGEKQQRENERLPSFPQSESKRSFSLGEGK